MGVTILKSLQTSEILTAYLKSHWQPLPIHKSAHLHRRSSVKIDPQYSVQLYAFNRRNVQFNTRLNRSHLERNKYLGILT